MSFQPVLVANGIAGWRFLQRTYDSQLHNFSNSTTRNRETSYFMEKIGTVKTAEDLVSDRRLLQVALGAFGLQDDVNNIYFVRKILEDGTASPDALANKLSDKRYREFSKAFGLGPGEIRTTGLVTFMEDIVARHEAAGFEEAIGTQDESMRIALYARHELKALAQDRSGENAKWFSLMGTPPLRQMMETALGLPSGLGRIDIDKQLEIFKDKLQALTGSANVSQFTDPDMVEKVTVAYLARAQISSQFPGTSAAQNALTLLGGFS
ncbi:DUF1217 domain-containing protein [Ruegeria marina]|uniref:Flagellar protein n=1 Tax=Ruegeria marina TaxID=639004 RepID=A0A1G6P083_9RHOB|nr:DUF1217 domain-containing protein [Ruegeria marina]SDC73331.1 Protein of unknown function [Ruegeria marina]